MCRLSAIVILVALPLGAAAADPVPSVKETIHRGLTFLARDNLAWKEKRQCAECHHAPFTLWALIVGIDVNGPGRAGPPVTPGKTLVVQALFQQGR